MNKVTYVTGNYGKYISVKELFAKNTIDIDFFEYDFHELEINDIEKVSKAKAFEAYNVLGSPCFVTDAGFYINDYPNKPGYPGAFVKRSGISSDINALLDTMKNTIDRSCYFLTCVTFYDGINFYTFYGINKGNLANEIRGSNIKKAQSNLWYVFIPDNYNKTLAEMTDEERNNRDDRHLSATNKFMIWYQNEYLINKPMHEKKSDKKISIK